MKNVKLLFFITLFLCVLFFFRNFVIQQIVSLGAGSIIGAPVKIENLSFNIPQQSILVKGIQVYNPKGFIKKPFIEVKEAKCKFDAFPLLWGKIHIPLLFLDIHAVTLIKNTEGVTNIDSLKLVKQFESDKKNRRKFKPLRMNIDQLRGQVPISL